MLTKKDSFKEKKLESFDIEEKINPHLIENEIIDLRKGFEIQKLDPVTLVTAERFDVIAKYVYAYFWMKNLDSDWGKDLYYDHIYAFNRYREGDGSGKIGKIKFSDSFDKLLQSIQDNDFNDGISVVPISPSNIVIDGSHRTSACLAYRRPITCVRLQEHIPNRYDYDYFLRKGMALKYADFIAFEYCKLKKNTYVAVIFPSAVGGSSEIKSIFDESGSIVYEKRVNLSRNGLFNLVSQIYEKEPWCGSQEDGFKGIKKKANSCFLPERETRVFLIESNSIEKIKESKSKIRSFFRIGNHSIHISDYHEESIEIAKILFNENSIHFINYAEIGKYWKNQALFDEFKECLISKKVDLDLFCVEGSSAMSAYGIREANDLDFIHHLSEDINFENAYISNHNDESIHHTKTRDDLIFNPENHFYYKGIKFLSLENLYSMKMRRGEIKDLDDCRMISTLTKKTVFSQFNLLSIFIIQKRIRQYALRALRKINRVMRQRVCPIKKSAETEQLQSFPLRIVRRVYRCLALSFDSFKPFIRAVHYKNFYLYYSRGTSIVEGHSSIPVRFGGMYEPQETDTITHALKQFRKPVLIDIGANIGLMSLNILHEIPSAMIFAFEPGAHQHSLFQKTIKANALEGQIDLHNVAVGIKQGVHSFSSHIDKHSSGDGFFDTGRAGDVEKCSVDVVNLDLWWETIEFKNINAIKIDIEGAELWALKGGVSLINTCKPIIVLEIHLTNLMPYPYDAHDILTWLEDQSYQLETMSGNSVNSDNLTDILNCESSFVAFPY